MRKLPGISRQLYNLCNDDICIKQWGKTNSKFQKIQSTGTLKVCKPFLYCGLHFWHSKHIFLKKLEDEFQLFWDIPTWKHNGPQKVETDSDKLSFPLIKSKRWRHIRAIKLKVWIHFSYTALVFCGIPKTLLFPQEIGIDIFKPFYGYFWLKA